MNIKEVIKNNETLYDLIKTYLVRFDYGYLHSSSEIQRFLKRLEVIEDSIPYDKEKKDIFIIIGDKNIDSTLRVAVFGDIDEGNAGEECIFFTTRILKDKKLSAMHTIFFKINKIVPLPFKQLWEKLYTTNNLCAMKEYNMFVIFMAGAYYEETFSQPLLFKRIHSFSKETFCKKVLYLADPIDKYPNLSKWFPYFDAIASYSQEDNIKYGTSYIDTPCVKFSDIVMPPSKVDIYFRGMDAGRASLINECYDYLMQHGIKCDFHIQTQSKKYQSREGMEFSNNRLPYRKMIEEECGANVLLEILINGIGSGPTLRTKEAILYGKKLLTNNPEIIKSNVYLTGNIQYFERVSDIDLNWFSRVANSNYPYADEFSVDVFFKRIKNLFIM